MYVKIIALLMLSVAVLLACSSSPQVEPPPPAQDITIGSTFTVTRDFLVPSGNTSVYFQDTKLYPLGDIQTDDPVCQFLISAATVAGQVISGRTLLVSAVDYDENGIGLSGMDATVTIIRLKDSSSHESFTLKCMLPIKSHGARPVNRAEIQGALGDYLVLKVSP
jgi:hypothetical protein